MTSPPAAAGAGGAHERLRRAAAEMEIDGEAIKLIDACREIEPALKAMVAGGRPADAIAIAARLLPKPYAVAWICRCVRTQNMEDEDRAAIAVSERWLRQPSEESRSRAADFAAAAQHRTVGAWIAAAAGWSGGSMAPAGQPAVAPPDHLTARAASTALVLLASRTPILLEAKLSGFVDEALAFFAGSGAAAPRSAESKP